MKYLKQAINFKLYIILINVLLLFSSCEKVIDLQLDTAKPVIVIEGRISDENENQEVRISKTYNFTEPNRFNGVSGAKIILTTTEGIAISYTEISPGVYQTDRFRGIPGTKYTLGVNIDGITYSATSIMPEKVTIDSLNFKKFNFFGKDNTYVSVNYTDPIGISNQYRYILKIKGKVEDDVVSEDRFNDGNKVSNTIFYDLNDLQTGDEINIEFQCIDNNVYRYFFGLNRNSGEDGPPVAPENPASNFNNGALGVFNAHTSSERTAMVNK